MKKVIAKTEINLFFPEFYNSNIDDKSGKEYGWIATRFDKPYYMTLNGAKEEAKYHKSYHSESKHRIVKKTYSVSKEEIFDI